MVYIGNIELLQLPKTAFLSSRNISPQSVIACYDRATQQRSTSKITMGHITQEHLQQSRIAIPPKELTLELDKIIAPVFARKLNNDIQNQQLSSLRDWLLPMLMNGQVRLLAPKGEQEMEVEMLMAAEPKINYGRTNE